MRLRQLLNILNRHPVLFLSIGIVAYILVFSGLSFWKYDNFLYNALDLGIYTQVFESFRTGNFWYSSIQQSSYLGDHFEPFILALLPFYLLIPHPKTLLVLQTIFLAIPAIPIFFIAREVFYPHLASPLARGRNGGGLQNQTPNLWALGVSFFYLLNPLVHNINLFEFHLLPFSLIFLFTAAYFYITTSPSPSLVRRGAGRYFLFLLFCFLSILAREDIPLIIFMFGILALIERRRWYWVAGPMILAGWWFILSMGIISAFNIDGGYKFLAYYGWLFQTSPIQFIIHIFGETDNWIMVFGFLFIFFFIPLLKPRFLVLVLPPLLQFALVSGGSGGVVWIIHYAAYFLPALFLASIFGIKRLINLNSVDYFKNKFYGFIFRDRGLLITVSTLSIIGLIIILGPLGNFIPMVNDKEKRSVVAEETRVQKYLVGLIPNQSGAVLSTSYLSRHWSNQNDSALYWLLGGFKQFSSQVYVPNFSTEYALIDGEDILGSIFSRNDRQNGDNRVRDFLDKRGFFVQNYIDRFTLFSKTPSKEALYEVFDYLPKNKGMKLNNQIVDREMNIDLAVFGSPEISNTSIDAIDNFSVAAFPLFWEKVKNTNKIYVMNIVIRNNRGKIIVNRNYPLGYGLYPASDWEIGKVVQMNQRILLPKDLSGEYGIYLRLIDATDGKFVLDQMRSGMVSVSSKITGEEIFLGKITVANW